MASRRAAGWRRTAGAAVVLAAGISAQVAAEEAKTSVLLLRHCPRSPYANDRHPPAPPNDVYTYPDNFTEHPFPSSADWGVAQGACTVRGLEAAAELGAALRQRLLGSAADAKTRVISDSTGRCVDTAAALNLNTSAIEVDQALFDPLSAKLATCTQPDWQGVLTRQLQDSADEFARERAKFSALQEVLGHGVAPALADVPDTVLGGYLVGGMRVASELLVETFILEQGSELPVAWGKLDAAGLHEFQTIHTTYFRAMYGNQDVAQRYGSGTLALLAKKFQTPDEPLTVLSGHDTTTIAVGKLLGLEWQCGSWAAGGTMPLSGFLFTLDDSKVSVQAVCHTFEAGEEPLATSPAHFPDGKDSVPLPDFLKLVNAVTMWSCVNSSDVELAPLPMVI